MNKLLTTLLVVALLAITAPANARGHHYSYSNSDIRYGKTQKMKSLLGIHRHSYRIVKR